MKFITLSIIASLASLISASPIDIEARQTPALCSGVTGTPQCCAVDVLGVADLNCANPPSTPTSLSDFTSICAAIGQQARCCAIPILDQDLICNAPV